jgi:hypothetical protein
MRVVRRMLVVGALSALVVGFVPSAGAQTPTVTSVIAAADGLSAIVDLEIELIELGEEGVDATDVEALQDVDIGPLPSVSLPPEGGSVEEEVLGLDELDELLTASVLRASAEGATGPDGFANAESQVLDLELLEPFINGVDDVGAQQIGSLVSAEAITATCVSDLSGVTGATTLVNAQVLGTPLASNPAPNTPVVDIDLGPASALVTLNQQVANPDGSLSVTPFLVELEFTLDEILTLTATLQVGPATCGVNEGVIPADVVVPAAPIEVTPRFTG